MARFTEKIDLRCRPEHLETLRTAAEMGDLTLSELVRRAALREARQILADPHAEPLEEAHDGR